MSDSDEISQKTKSTTTTSTTTTKITIAWKELGNKSRLKNTYTQERKTLRHWTDPQHNKNKTNGIDVCVERE